VFSMSCGRSPSWIVWACLRDLKVLIDQFKLTVGLFLLVVGNVEIVQYPEIFKDYSGEIHYGGERRDIVAGNRFFAYAAIDPEHAAAFEAGACHAGAPPIILGFCVCHLTRADDAPAVGVETAVGRAVDLGARFRLPAPFGDPADKRNNHVGGGFEARLEVIGDRVRFFHDDMTVEKECVGDLTAVEPERDVQILMAQMFNADPGLRFEAELVFVDIEKDRPVETRYLLDRQEHGFGDAVQVAAGVQHPRELIDERGVHELRFELFVLLPQPLNGGMFVKTRIWTFVHQGTSSRGNCTLFKVKKPVVRKGGDGMVEREFQPISDAFPQTRVFLYIS
jgi:hypothetical protein